MNKSYSYRLNDLFEELVAGKYHEVIDEAEKILQNDKTDVETRIEAKLAKSWSLYYLAEFEFREEYTEKALEAISEAYQMSLEIECAILMFDTIFMKIWSFSQINKHKEVVDTIEKANDIYEKLKKEHPILSKEKESFLLTLCYLKLYHKEYIIENYKYDFEKSIDYLNKALEINTETRNKGSVLNKVLTLILYYLIYKSYLRISNYSKAVECQQIALKIAEENKNEYWMSFIFQLIGQSYWLKGKYDLHLDFTMKSREVSEKQGNIRGVGASHHKIGIYYGEIGEWKKALKHSQKAYDILLKDVIIEKSEIIARITNNIAICYYMMGEFDKALTHYDKAIEYNTKRGDEGRVQLNHANRAVIHIQRGEFDIALKIYNEIAQYCRRRGFKLLLSNALWNLSFIYQSKGLFNKAHEKLVETLQIYDEIEIKTEITSVLYRLVLLSMEFDRIELAKKYFEELERKSEDVEYKSTKNQVLQAEAAILEKSSAARDRMRAELIYDQLLNEQLTYSVHMGIIFHLCELLLSELKISSDERILAKLQKHVNNLIELSTKNHITALIVESLWFKAQLSLLNLDFEKAKELLTQAQTIAEEKGLNRHTLKIMKSKEQLVQQLVELEDLEKESPTISKRMDAIKIENGFKEITNSQMFQFKQNI